MQWKHFVINPLYTWNSLGQYFLGCVVSLGIMCFCFGLVSRACKLADTLANPWPNTDRWSAQCRICKGSQEMHMSFPYDLAERGPWNTFFALMLVTSWGLPGAARLRKHSPLQMAVEKTPLVTPVEGEELSSGFMACRILDCQHSASRLHSVTDAKTTSTLNATGFTTPKRCRA